MGKKQRNNKGFKLFVIILTGIILFFSTEKNQEKFIEFINTTSIIDDDLEIITSIPMEEDIDDMAYYDDSVLVWIDKKLLRYNLEGSKEWEKEFNFEDPMISFEEEGIFVYERSIGDIYSLNSKGETMERFQLNTKIKDIVKSHENILVHIKEEGNEGIRILDTSGNIMANKFIEEDKILTSCLNEDNNIYALSTLNLKGGNVKSEVQVFNLESEFLWTTYLENEIVVYLNFIEDEKIIAMSDKGLYSIYDDNILWKRDHQLIKDIYMDREYIYILYGNTFEIISFDGETIKKNSFAEEYKKIIPSATYTILYGSEHIIGLREGKEMFKYRSEDMIVRILQGEENLIIVYEDRIDVVSL